MTTRPHDPLGRAPDDPCIIIGSESHHHLVKLNLRWRLDGGDVLGVHAEALISPRAAFDLARNLVTHGVSALESIAADHAAGDCPTCQNLRLVDVMLPGRTRPSSVVCPDCRPAWEAWTTTVPTIPGWSDDERKVLAR